MTNSTVLAVSFADRWHGFWSDPFGEWILARGVPIALYLIGGLLAARFITWLANRIVRRIDAEYPESDQLVRSESAKHRQAVASVISWVSVALLFVIVIVQVTTILAIPVGSLVAPAAVLGAALGFGAQRVVQDLLAGFFIITEKQYGFGDLVSLTVGNIAEPAEGTVEDVTLRVTKLRSTEGEMYTIPNGQIVKSVNLSKDWARAVIDIPVPAAADLNVVNDVLQGVAEEGDGGSESGCAAAGRAPVDGCGEHRARHGNLRMVARTLPGKQFEVGRRYVSWWSARCAGPASCRRRGSRPDGGGHRAPGHRGRGRRDAGTAGAEEVRSWLSARLGRMRVSTIVLIVAFLGCSGLSQLRAPVGVHRAADRGSSRPASCRTRTNVVPRTNVRPPKEPRRHHADTPVDRGPRRTSRG
jgi:small conductance mechanosensitive channel